MLFLSVHCRDLSGTKLTALNASMMDGMSSLQRLYVVPEHCIMVLRTMSEKN